ncbi:MAG: AAA family ATPase [bacterium]
METKSFRITYGPIFTNFLLADEINRSPPKTQSALLQAMQEKKEIVIALYSSRIPVHSGPFLYPRETENRLYHSGLSGYQGIK